MTALVDNRVAFFLGQPQIFPAKHLHRLVGAQPRHQRRRVASTDKHSNTIAGNLGERDANCLME